MELKGAMRSVFKFSRVNSGFSFWLLVGFLSFSCDSGEGTSQELESVPAVSDDTITPVVQTAATPIEDVADDAILELGTNVTGMSTPDSFSALGDGDDLFVELGFQGSYMVVLAVRTRGFVTEGKVNLQVALSVGGEEKAKLKYKKKSLLPGTDDLSYFYNIFLVTEDYEDYVDEEAFIEITVLTLDDEPIVSVDASLVIKAPL
jgi:hypothetical protein